MIGLMPYIPTSGSSAEFSLLGTDFGTYSLAGYATNRWVIFAATGFSANSIGTAPAPTIGGAAMTEILQVNSNASSDGHRVAVFAKQVTSGASVTIVDTGFPGPMNNKAVFSLSGVTNAVGNAILPAGTTFVGPTGSPVLALYVNNFGSITAIPGMTLLGGDSTIGYDIATSSGTMNYAVTAESGPAIIRTLVGWAYDS